MKFKIYICVSGAWSIFHLQRQSLTQLLIVPSTVESHKVFKAPSLNIVQYHELKHQCIISQTFIFLSNCGSLKVWQCCDSSVRSGSSTQSLCLTVWVWSGCSCRLPSINNGCMSECWTIHISVFLSLYLLTLWKNLHCSCVPINIDHFWYWLKLDLLFIVHLLS